MGDDAYPPRPRVGVCHVFFAWGGGVVVASQRSAH